MVFIRSLILVIAIILAIVPAEAKAAGPTLVFDLATSEVLSHDRAGEPWYPASITKLMTAYVVFHKLRSGQLALTQKVPVSKLAASQPASKIGMREGDAVSVDFALQALLVYSANDMAFVLAEAASGSVAAFANEMNAASRRLGMTGTHYVNPNGLHDPRQITTARDTAVLASALLKEFQEHGHYFAQDSVVIGKRKLANRNSLIRQMNQADGMKTGFICSSGYNLVATATNNGRRLGAIVFGANSGKHRADLAEMLLVDAFARAPVNGRPKLEQIGNMEQGAIVPADLTPTVCRQKNRVTLVNPREIAGWGVSFGSFDTPVKADMALRGRLLSSAGIWLPGKAGVMRMPGQTGFAAIVWSLDQSESLSACSGYREQQAPCDVLTPETFAQIANLTAAVKSSSEPVRGSSGQIPGKKKKKKKKKQ